MKIKQQTPQKKLLSKKNQLNYQKYIVLSFISILKEFISKTQTNYYRFSHYFVSEFTKETLIQGLKDLNFKKYKLIQGRKFSFLVCFKSVDLSLFVFFQTFKKEKRPKH